AAGNTPVEYHTAHGLRCLVGGGGCLVVAWAVAALARYPTYAGGASRDSRSLPRDQRAPWARGSPAGEQHGRATVHLHLGPAGGRVAEGRLRRRSFPRAPVLPGARVGSYRAPRLACV